MEQNQELFSLQVDPIAKSYLYETARWGKFLAIVGFIVCGLVVIAGVGFGSVFSTLMARESEMSGMGGAFGAMAAVFYILFALLYFFPCLFLFRFSTKMKVALNSDSQDELNISFQNLKSLFKFVGILTIIIFSIYALVAVFAVIGLAAAA